MTCCRSSWSFTATRKRWTRSPLKIVRQYRRHRRHSPNRKSQNRGGSDTDKLADAILSAGEKPRQANAVAQEDKRRIYQLIRDGYAADREGFLNAVYAAGEGAVEREEIRGMLNGLK